MPNLRWEGWWGLASAAAMLLGAFGPWGKANIGFAGVTVSGTDGSNDGWLVVAAALVGGGAVLAAQVRDSQRWPIVALLAGVASGWVTWSDRRNFQDRADEVDEGIVQVGWGLNLALAASVSLVVAAAVIGERRRKRGLVAAEQAPVKRPKRPSTTPPAPTPASPVEPAQSPPKVVSPSTSAVGELERLSALRGSGALSDDEFEAAKRRVLEG